MAFQEKVVLITGGSSGLGSSTAVFFAREGALLALVARRAERFDEILPQLQEHCGENEPLIIIADVSVDAERIIEETIAKYERLDILINNAGIMTAGNIETTTPDQYDAIMNTNVRGVIALTQAAIPHLIESKGNVVNVSSVAGICHFPEYLVYCMSKAALDQFTKCVALSLAPKGVRVNSVNPAAVPTNLLVSGGMKEQEAEAVLEGMKSAHPIGRLGEPMDVAEAIGFLANEKSSWITGVCLPLDGGLSINLKLN